MTPRGRLTVLIAVVAVALAGLIALAAGGGGEEDAARPLEPGRGATQETADPLAWREDRREDFERRAARGLSHVLYAKSPGGAVATAERVARYRPLVDEVARRHGPRRRHSSRRSSSSRAPGAPTPARRTTSRAPPA